jgi:hypothetical protein
LSAFFDQHPTGGRPDPLRTPDDQRKFVLQLKVHDGRL